MKKHLIGVMAVLMLTGCAPVDLNSFPKDMGQAEAMMNTVADRAKCGGFEYYNHSKDFWEYTCQQGEQGERFFTLVTAPSQEKLEEQIRIFSEHSYAYEEKSTYVVAARRAEWLEPFR